MVSDDADVLSDVDALLEPVIALARRAGETHADLRCRFQRRRKTRRR